MAINKQTIISAYDEKLTLLQWLKTINKALDEAVLTGVEVRQKGNATYSFVVTFEDGTELESNEFVLAQGESINGATIRNGHLYLSLTNGDELDAGNVKPVTSFEINESQHLIVNYGDGTTQDLGAIFTGNINIDGNFTANSIIENMNGYSFEKANDANATRTYYYAGVVKTGNKITFVIFLDMILNVDASISGPIINCGRFNIPRNVADKLYPVSIGSGEALSSTAVFANTNYINTGKIVYANVVKTSPTQINFGFYVPDSTPTNTRLTIRLENTFLLSDNMAV